jgi:hypothetical protein
MTNKTDNAKPRIHPNDLTMELLEEYAQLTGSNRELKVASACLEPDDFQRLRVYSHVMGKSVSSVIRKAIMPFILMTPPDRARGYRFEKPRQAA